MTNQYRGREFILQYSQLSSYAIFPSLNAKLARTAVPNMPDANYSNITNARVVSCRRIEKMSPYAGVVLGESAGVAIGSSEEFVRDRYAVQKIPTVDTNGCESVSNPSSNLVGVASLQFGTELA